MRDGVTVREKKTVGCALECTPPVSSDILIFCLFNGVLFGVVSGEICCPLFENTVGAVPSCSRPWRLFQCKWPSSGALQAYDWVYLSSTKRRDLLVFELDSPALFRPFVCSGILALRLLFTYFITFERRGRTQGVGRPHLRCFK